MNQKVLVALAAMLLEGVVYSLETAALVPPGASMWGLRGLAGGGAWALAMWWEKGRKNREVFNGPKVIRALLIGVVVGLVALRLGVSVQVADELIHRELLNAGLLGSFSGALDWLAAGAWKKLKKLIAKLRAR